jgi:hypothetical protein
MKNNAQIYLQRASGLRFVASGFLNMLIVALVFACGHTAACGAGLGRAAKLHPSFPAQDAVTINLRDYQR